MHRIGPACWRSFNRIAQEYNPIMKEDVKQLFIETGQHFPCAGCRQHYQGFLTVTNWEQVTESMDTLVKFITDLHNSVNIRLGRHPISNSEARDVILREGPVSLNELALVLPVRLFFVFKIYNDKYTIFTCN